jgi:tRNA(Ile2)-agmatinylcytidine synthase
MYIGIDDTDSVKGMCTTYLSSELIKELEEFDIIKYPRLVRLNPNVPWKTRGNGAICIRIGKGAGKRHQIAEIGSKCFYGYEREKCVDNDLGRAEKEDVFERVLKIVEKNSKFDDDNTNPGAVLMDERPSSKLYWQGVRSVIDLKDVKKILELKKAIYKGYKNGRGIIGATAAIAWCPKDRTYEVITYRHYSKWGTPRTIDESSVIVVDKKFTHTFNNYDYENRRVIIAPHSPCPVLFGIRGDTPQLIEPMKTIKSEKVDRWVIFETNQGTDDHLEMMRIENLKPYKSAIVSGNVASKPKTILGGHVIFKLVGSASTDCAAYEPTKNFRSLIKELVPGDKVTVYGSVRKYPFTLNIEKIKINKLADIYKKLIPICKCGHRMESIGRNKGYRCRKCNTKTTELHYEKIVRRIKECFYEVPVCARRHLSKPLKRFDTRKNFIYNTNQ